MTVTSFDAAKSLAKEQPLDWRAVYRLDPEMPEDMRKSVVAALDRAQRTEVGQETFRLILEKHDKPMEISSYRGDDKVRVPGRAGYYAHDEGRIALNPDYMEKNPSMLTVGEMGSLLLHETDHGITVNELALPAPTLGDTYRLRDQDESSACRRGDRFRSELGLPLQKYVTESEADVRAMLKAVAKKDDGNMTTHNSAAALMSQGTLGATKNNAELAQVIANFAQNGVTVAQIEAVLNQSTYVPAAQETTVKGNVRG